RLYPDWGITVLSASLTFWVFVFNGFLYLKMRQVTKSFRANPASDNKEKLKLRDLIRSGRDNFILMLAGRASLQTNNLFVGLFHGQADVTKLYATQRLFEVVQTQLFAVGNASWASLAQIYHQNKLDLFRSRVLQLLKLIMILGLSVVVPLLFRNKGFVGLWIGNERYGGNSLSIVSGLLTIGLGFTVFSTWCLMCTGHLQSVLRLSVITAILDISATLIFTKTLGLIGPALGSCIVLYLVTIPWHILLLKKIFGIQFFSIAKSFKLPILSIPFYLALNIYLSESFSASSMVILANLIFWPALAYQLFQAYFAISEDEWRQIKSRFRINN
ncbi:MAG: lipopolysaccharide biosynthesis protein, partial [bacterium]